MDWIDLFEEYIMNRGYAYYLQDTVTNVKMAAEKNTVQAKVSGSEVYEVEISFAGSLEQITNMECDCPHFAAGHNCKHLAAFCFYLDDNFEGLAMAPQNPSEIKKSEIQDLVQVADEKMVRAFLTDILIADRHLQNQFRTLTTTAVSNEDLKSYQKEIDNLFKAHQHGRGKFIDYRSANHLEVELFDFIDKTIENTLLRLGFYEEAFELTKRILLKFTKVAIDDSDGVITNVMNHCVAIWEEIMTEAPLETKRKIYKWFKQQLQKGDLDLFEDFVEASFFNHFTEKEFLDDRQKFSLKIFEQFHQSSDAWNAKYQAAKWGAAYLKIRVALGAEPSEIKAFAKEHQEYRAIFEFFVDWTAEQGEINEAIALLEDYRAEVNEYGRSRLTREYQKRLKDLYKTAGKAEAYRTELWDLMLNGYHLDRDIYLEYKSLFSTSEWLKVRDEILSHIAHANEIDSVYAEEGLYDLLLENAVKHYNLNKIERHQEELFQRYPAEVFARYQSEVYQQAQESGPRKKYKQIAQLIKGMRDIFGADYESEIAEIVQNLREQYKNRPAMMAELPKV